MPFRFRAGKNIQREFRRIAREQVERAQRELDEQSEGRHEAVHDVRKRCKKIRGLIRLVRPAFDEYSAANEHFRDTARLLSVSRDATTLIECFDALVTRFESSKPADIELLRPLRIELHDRRAETTDDEQLDERITEVRVRLHDSLNAIETWQLHASGFDAIGGGFTKTYDRGRKAFRTAYKKLLPEQFHEWRKRVKYHRYHLGVISDCWPGPIKARCDEAKTLSDILGDEHDLTVLGDVLQNEGPWVIGEERVAILQDLIERRRGELRARARTLGQRLYAEKPKQFERRIRQIWKAWCRDAREKKRRKTNTDSSVS